MLWVGCVVADACMAAHSSSDLLRKYLGGSTMLPVIDLFRWQLFAKGMVEARVPLLALVLRDTFFDRLDLTHKLA